MFCTGTEKRIVPIRNRARHGMRSEIATQPHFLRRADVATPHFLALAIQYDDVPGTQVIAVVAGLGVSGRRAEVLEIIGGTG